MTDQTSAQRPCNENFQEEGGLILVWYHKSVYFRVIKSSSYKPGNTNRAAAGTLQQCKLQALWLTEIYGGTHLPSNPQQWKCYYNRLPRAGGCCTPGNVQGQHRQGSDLVKVSLHIAGGGTRWFLKVLSHTNHPVIPWFFSSLSPRSEAECDACRSEEQQIQKAPNEATLAIQAKCGEILAVVKSWPC